MIWGRKLGKSTQVRPDIHHPKVQRISCLKRPDSCAMQMMCCLVAVGLPENSFLKISHPFLCPFFFDRCERSVRACHFEVTNASKSICQCGPKSIQQHQWRKASRHDTVPKLGFASSFLVGSELPQCIAKITRHQLQGHEIAHGSRCHLSR